MTDGSALWDVNPTTSTASLLVSIPDVDGLCCTPSGQYVMTASKAGLQLIDLLPTPHVAYSVLIARGDGIAVGMGPNLAGNAYVNTTDGKLWEVVYDTNPSNALELEPPGSPIVNLIASGGSRGDFVAVDMRVLCGGATEHWPSLLITQSDSIVRIDPPDAGFFGPPFSVEAVISVDQSFCAGDGTLATNCPCSNFGLPGQGCDNSIGSGGALLTVTGSTVPDTMVLLSTGELPTSASVFLQGSIDIANGIVFGDGVRCVGGALKRIGVKNAVSGEVFYPDLSDASITARSAALGDPLTPGTRRYYQVFYRDPVTGYCGSVADTLNISNAIRIDW